MSTITAGLENVYVLAYAMRSWNAIVKCKSVKVMTNNTLVSERYLLITCSYHFCRQMYNSKIFPAFFLGSTSTSVREFTKNRVSDFIDFEVFFHEIRLAVNCSFYPLLCAFINLDRHGRNLVIFFQKSKC